MALTPEKIAELLAKGRVRGGYDKVLADFIESGEAGIEVDLTTGPIAGKTSKQAVTGFNLTRKRTNDKGELRHEAGPNVRVIESDGNVYLINTAVTVTEEE